MPEAPGVIYAAGVALLRESYLEALLALEDEFAGKYAAMSARYCGKFRPSNGDSRALYDALALTCMQSEWRPYEAEFTDRKDALFADFQARCAEMRRELGL